ncbi:MAG: hypothetical protein U0K87_05065 [Ruminococcus sp.]|nr:hypothetical protein [Ruminococcus sp.]
MGVEERYKKKTEEKKAGALYNGVENRYLSKNVESVGKEISNRVNTWLKNNETYFSNAQKRFSGENAAYRTDTTDWLSTVSKQRENFQKEAENIKSVLNQYKDVLGQEYVNSVYKALDGNLKAQESIIDASNKDIEYWSQWANEDEYNTALRYDRYQKKYEGKSYDEVLSLAGKLQDGEEKEWLKANRYNILSTSSDFAEKSQYKTTYRGGEKFNSWAGMYTDTGYDDIMYDYINGDKRAIDRQAVSDIATNAAFLGLDNSERREMEEEEVAIFNYLYATQGSETAYEYIKYLTSDLNARQRDTEQKKWAEYAKESPVGSSLFSVFTSPLKGLSYVGQIGDYMQDGAIDQNAGYNKFSYINSAIRDEVSKIAEANWGGVGSFAYQTGMSMGDFLFSTAVSGGNSALSLAIMGTGAASDTVISAKDRGLEDWQAFTLGTIAGAAEIAMEKIGLDALFDTAKLGKGALGYVLNNALSEGGEEVGTELINTLADILIAQDKSQFLTEYNYYMSQGESGLEAFGHALGDKLILAGLGGAVSGGILGGGGAVVGTIGQTIKGADMQKNFGSGIGASLTAEALEIDPSNPYAQKMQSKLDSGKTLSNRQVGNLMRQNETAMYENDVASIQNAVESRLAELGEKGDVKALAKAITKKAVGEGRNVADITRTLVSEYGRSVAKDLNAKNIRAGKTNDWTGKIGTDRINAEEYSRLIENLENEHPVNQDMVYQALENKLGKPTQPAQPVEDVAESVDVAEPADAGEAQAVSAPENVTAEETAAEAPTEDEANKDTARVAEIISAGGGVVTVRLDNGETKNADDVDFGNDEVALVYRAAADMSATVGGFSTDTVRVFVNGFKPGAGLTAAEYVHGFRDAYRYGAEGAPISELARGAFTSKLTEEQRNRAFHFGRAFGNEKVSQAKEQIDAKKDATVKEKAAEPKTKKSESIKKVDTKQTPKKDTKPKAAERKEEVFYDGDRKALTERQKASIEFLERVFGGRGMKITFFESYVDEDGRRVYKNAAGEVVPAPNGKYDSTDGSVMIDINAGKRGEGAILGTASHELTHFMKDQSPELYRAYAEFVFEQYGKGEHSLDYYVQKRLEIAEKSGRPISEADAYDEVIADSSETMLNDIINNKNQDNLQKLIAKDKTLFDKIKEFFADLLERIKEAYRGVEPQSREGKYIREMVDVAEKLQAMWTEALVDAVETYEAIGVAVDDATGSASPQLSERTWTESEYVTERDAAAKDLATSVGVSIKKATEYIDNVNSIARVIANDRARLDYESSSFGSAFVSNAEYGGSFDFTTLCKKRRIYTGTFSEIQKRIGDNVLYPEDILKIRNMMIEGGIEATCGLCYVEGSRANMGKFSKEFIRLYKRDNPGAWIPSMVDVNTPDGVEQMRINHPEAFDSYLHFWNHYGKLKDSDPALFASQQKPRLYEARKEYKGEIIENFKNEKAIAKKNLNGGIRMQSFSDFEIVHLIDTMQIIMDMSRVGLAGQAYTKVPEFADAFGNTGLKINLSLIAKGVDENGNLVFDDREGMPADTAFKLRDKYSENVGTIIVAFTDEQLLAAMADPRIDFIIPFHRSQWKKNQYGAMGLPKGTKDYTYMQNEKLIKPTYHEYAGRMVRDKASNYMPNEYWDFSLSGKENAEVYLEMCAKNNKRPKFYKLLDYDGNGKYSLKADGSTDGYWKLLIDFKMYDNDGLGSPQRAVSPDFSMDEAMTMLEEYKGGHQSYPVAHGVVDKFVDEYNAKSTVKYSERDYFVEDKYFGSQVAKWEDLKQGAYVNVGQIGDKHPLHEVGMPAGVLRYDVDKIKKNMSDHGDYLSIELLAAIPDIIANPVAISEYSAENTVSVFGDVFVGKSPMMVGVTISKDRAGNDISKVRTFNARRDIGKLITDESILYLDEDKKRTQKWFQACGIQVPLGETKFGFIRTIAQKSTFVNSNSQKFSERDIAEDDIAQQQSRAYDDNGNVIPLSQRFNTGIDDIRYQQRDASTVSNRELLATALESAAKNDIEKNKLKAYKEKISVYDAEEAKLVELRRQLKEISFARGTRDTKKVEELRSEAEKTARRISIYDKQLLSLEASAPLKEVLKREKQKAYKNAREDVRVTLDNYRERADKTEMRHKIRSITKELNNLLLKPTAKKHIKEELRKEVAQALSAINMDTVGADERVAMYNKLITKESDPTIREELTKTRDRIRQQGDNLKERLNALQIAYEKIKDTDDIELNLSYKEAIQNSIKAVSEKVGDTPIRKMTFEQLEEVYELFKMIRHTIRDANKAFNAKKGETIEQMATSVDSQVRSVGDRPYMRNAVVAQLIRTGWKLLKPYVAFRTIGSDALTNLYKELRNGEDTFYEDVTEAQKFIEEQYEKHGYKNWGMRETETFKSKSGKEFALTLEQRLTLYAYSKREQAHDHIIKGGIVFEDALVVEKNKLGIPIKYEVTTKDAFNLSEETFKEIANSLTKEQKAYADEMQAYLSVDVGAKGNEVSMKLLGVKLFKEKFYLPIKSSQYYMNFKAEEAGEVKLRSPAFSKETVKHANNPIVIHNFTDLWSEHINDMAMYHSFVLALEDFTRVYNYHTGRDANSETVDIKATLETSYPGVTKYINKFLKDMNGGVRSETVGWAEKLTSLTKKGAVLGSASVTIQQPSAIMRAMAYISPKFFVPTKPKSISLSEHQKNWAELKKYAPIAGIKEMGRFDVGMGQATSDWIKSNKTAMEKAEDIVSKPPAFMDEVTWITIWNAVKRETAHNNPKLETSSEEFLKLAGERFTDVISLSQVYDSVFSRSDLMRNKSLVAKWLTAFMAEPTTTMNMLWDSFVQGKRTGSKSGFVGKAAAAGGAVIASMVLNAALKSIVMAMRDDDEDESYIEKYLEHFAGDLKDNINPLTLVPFVKDVVSIFNGYDIERMDVALLSDLKDAIDAFDSDNKNLYEKWSGLIGSISACFGVPVKNIERDTRALITTIFGETEETTVAGMLYAIEKGLTGKEKSNGQQLYEAILKGDTEQIERVKARFEDQSDIDAAIYQALKENDPRIKEAANARISGDIATYTKIAKKIIGEGLFSQDIVVAAINSEIRTANSAIGKPKEETESDEIKSIYVLDDFYKAIRGNNLETAYVVREDIIGALVDNGSGRKDAEKKFESDLVSYVGDQYKYGLIEDAGAIELLMKFGGKTKEEASSRIRYWAFVSENPEYKDLTESAVNKYYDGYYKDDKLYAKSAQFYGISLDVYAEYFHEKSGLTKKEDIMYIINTLPLTREQKDALYYLNGWAKSGLKDAPWR